MRALALRAPSGNLFAFPAVHISPCSSPELVVKLCDVNWCMLPCGSSWFSSVTFRGVCTLSWQRASAVPDDNEDGQQSEKDRKGCRCWQKDVVASLGLP